MIKFEQINCKPSASMVLKSRLSSSSRISPRPVASNLLNIVTACSDVAPNCETTLAIHSSREIDPLAVQTTDSNSKFKHFSIRSICRLY